MEKRPLTPGYKDLKRLTNFSHTLSLLTHTYCLVTYSCQLHTVHTTHYTLTQCHLSHTSQLSVTHTVTQSSQSHILNMVKVSQLKLLHILTQVWYGKFGVHFGYRGTSPTSTAISMSGSSPELWRLEPRFPTEQKAAAGPITSSYREHANLVTRTVHEHTNTHTQTYDKRQTLA